MAEPKGKLVTPIGFDPAGKPLALEVDASGYLKVVLTGAAGSDLLTELQQKLETADLNIEAISKDLQVDVKSSALPTDAATQTTLALLLTELQQKLETADLNIEAVSKDLQVDVKSSALPTDAATQTTLSLLLTELQQKLETANLNIEAGSKDLQVDVKSAPPTQTFITSPYDGLVACHGFVNAAWHKNPISFGFSNTLCIRIGNFDLPAGDSGIYPAACPANFIWVITSLNMCYVGTSPTLIEFNINLSGSWGAILRQASPVSNAIYKAEGWWVLKEGDTIYGYVLGATLHDDFYINATGFAVAINL